MGEQDIRAGGTFAGTGGTWVPGAQHLPLRCCIIPAWPQLGILRYKIRYKIVYEIRYKIIYKIRYKIRYKIKYKIIYIYIDIYICIYI